MQTFIYQFRCSWWSRLTAIAVTFFSLPATAASISGTKSFLVATPISIVGGELGLKAEYNLWNSAALGLELMLAPEREDCIKKEKLASGCSILSSASEFSLSFARYSHPGTMSGMFWAANAGLRRASLEWTRANESASLREKDPNQEFLLSELETSKIKASGPAYRIRAGYRYAAESIPLVSGLYGGLKHFDGTYKDVDGSDSISVPTSDDERNSIRHRMMTGLEIGFELGMIF